MTRDSNTKKTRKNAVVIIIVLVVFLSAIPIFLNQQPDDAAVVMATTQATATSIETSTPVEKASVTLTFAGDCTLGIDANAPYTNSFVYQYDRVDDPAWFFENVNEYFSNDDITMVNLETALTTSDDNKDKEFAFKGDPKYADILAKGSVEVVDICNNHAMDYNIQGYRDTKDALNEYGVGYFGYIVDTGEDNVFVKEVNGVKVAYIGYKEWNDLEDKKTRIKNNIEKLKGEESVDIVVVNFHWGEEGSYIQSADQILLAHYCIDNGADLVIGHHPHVVQEIEEYKGKYIAYSLGNFSFGGNYNPKDKDCIIFQQTFELEDAEVVDSSVKVIPCSISSVGYRNDYKPTPYTEEEDIDRVAKKINFEIE